MGGWQERMFGLMSCPEWGQRGPVISDLTLGPSTGYRGICGLSPGATGLRGPSGFD